MNIILTILVMLMAPLAPVRAAEFFPGLSDLPLMPGLSPTAEEPVIFDTPSGRIVETAAAGNIPAAAVRKFYLKTLPQLGWRFSGTDGFRREEEILKMTVERQQNDGTVVRFMLAPAK